MGQAARDTGSTADRGLSSILGGRAIRTRGVVALWVQRRRAISPAHTGESTTPSILVKCPLSSPLPSRGNPDSSSLKETHLVKTTVTSLSTALSCSAFLSLTLNCLCNHYHCCSQTAGSRENLFCSQFPGVCQVYRELGWNTRELVEEEEGRKQRAKSILGVRCNLGEHTHSSPRPHLLKFPKPLKMEPLAEDQTGNTWTCREHSVFRPQQS